MTPLDEKLDLWRKDLLDLSQRNRLLHFKPSRSGTVKLIEPESSAIFRRLAVDERGLRFYRSEERAPSPQLSLLQSGDPPAASSDQKTDSGNERLHRPLRSDEVRAETSALELDRVLYRIYLKARSSVLERGINVLFLTFGMLQWRDTPTGPFNQSPLVMVPVQLTRKTGLDPFEIMPHDDEIALNPTLLEKLRTQFGLTLELGEEDLSRPLPDLLGRVRAAIRKQPGWSVTDDVYLGLFQFHKLSMYRDLQDYAEQARSHPVIRALAGEANEMPRLPEGLPTEAELDSKVRPEATFQVLDADASQMQAIIAAVRGGSFIIQGPPGTGKSQTITNVIAECLAAGKKVLFVSEKAAALEVVHRRLEAAGLGDFCLELHSHRANKKAVLAELGRAMEGVPSPRAPRTAESFYVELRDTRARLNRYADALMRNREPLGLSCYDVHGRLASVIGAPDVLCEIPDSGRLTQETLSTFRLLVRRLYDNREAFLLDGQHPWAGTTIEQLALAERSAIRSGLSRLHAALREGEDLASQISEALGLRAPSTVEEYRWLLDTAALAQECIGVPPSWLGSANIEIAEAARKLQRESQSYHARRNRLLVRYQDGLFTQNAAEQLARLTDVRELGPFAVPCETAVDRALNDRSRIEEVLDCVVRTTQAVLDHGRALALLLGEGAATTLHEARRQAHVAELATKCSRPMPAWFSESDIGRFLDLAGQARSWNSVIEQELPALLAEYDRDVLALATPEFVARYEGRGKFRTLQPGYWRDRKRVKSLRINPVDSSFGDEVEALRRARRVSDALAWFVQRERDLQTAFGVHYLGPDTDWAGISNSLAAIQEILTLTNREPSPTLQQALVDSGPGISALGTLAHGLNLAVQEAQGAIGELTQLAPTAPPFLNQGGIESLDLVALTAWVSSIRDLLGRFWSIADNIGSFCADGNSVTGSQLLEDLRELADLQRIERDTADGAARLRAQFGSLYKGLETPWDKVLATIERAGQLSRRFPSNQPPSSFVDSLSDARSMQRGAEAIRWALSAMAVIDEELPRLAGMFKESAFPFCGEPLDRAPVPNVADWVQTKVERFEQLDDWLELGRVLRDLDESGLTGFATAVRQARIEPDAWEAALLKRVYTLWLDHIQREDPALGEFRGSRQDELVRAFRALDVAQLALAAKRVCDRLASQRPNLDGIGEVSGSEPAILRSELLKKRRHKPLRRLFREIPNLLVALKPCLLMSPLSVSLFLPADEFKFDVVIFDEASQVRPHEAVGPIMRAKQVIVVGDRKQLPPTSFFEAAADELEEEEDDTHGAYESILDECDARGMPSYMLRWHYRSRHENLIAFSNIHFYESRLITFPSVDPHAQDMGVRLVHVPNGIYERSGTRTNRVEARRVAELVLEEHRRRPERTLGVVTLSEAQMLAVLDELEALRRRDPSLETLFGEDRPEPFFVKNLEQVQGDERDVVILSIGYGRDATGKLSMHFGPLNRAGGERRLNVAITRARQQMLVVSSILASDIDLTRTQSRGAHLLRAYLDFAQRGADALAPVVTQEGGDYESPFEEWVGEALEERGFTVHRQVGASGYRVDLAIVDPDQPTRYLLGIECDGATYHSSRTARERDRLRQQVLEQLGWRIHRVWSTDWIREPSRELQRILEAIDKARRPEPSQPDPPRNGPNIAIDGSTVLDLLDDGEGKATSSQAAPSEVPIAPRQHVAVYRRAVLSDNLARWGSFHQAPFRAIVDAVLECVEAEGPIHRSLLASRVAQSWKVQRVGSKVEHRVRAAIEHLLGRSKVQVREDFVWPAELDMVAPRGATEDGEVRRIHEVPLEEIAAAARICTDSAFALPREELVVATARVLGYDRTGIHVFERISRGIELGIDRGWLAARGGRITVAA